MTEYLLGRDRTSNVERILNITDHCFTGEYPTPLTDLNAAAHTPRQLSLLAEAS